MVGPEFASCWLKIGRAEEHFNTFNAEFVEWMGCDPYSISTNSNADGSRYSVIVEIKHPPP
jgi:hypothetical protein